jgi:hypothetical protein
MKKPKEKINHSLLSSSSSSASIYYSKMSGPQIKKYDSGFSETATSVSSVQGTETQLEQILSVEKIYFEHLKQDIIKYSRPLRRYLNPDEIVDLFQNIEKVCEHTGESRTSTEFSLVSFRFLPSPNPSFVNAKNSFIETTLPTCRFQPSINHG